MSFQTESERMELVITQGTRYPEQRVARHANNANGSIVFLPDGLPLGRVGTFLVTENVPTPKSIPEYDDSWDDRGRYDWMWYDGVLFEDSPRSRVSRTFRGRPVPIKTNERWVETNHGTLVFGRVVADFLGDLLAVEVIEERQPAERDGEASEGTEEFIEWGANLAETRFVSEVHTTRAIEREIVADDGQLVWQVVRHRPLGKKGKKHAVKSIDSLRVELSVTYQDSWLFDCRVVYYTSPKTTAMEILPIRWGKMPPWLKARIEKEYPVCSCGKVRIDPHEVTQKHYQKCAECLRRLMRDQRADQPASVGRPLNTNSSRRLLERMRRPW